MTESNEMNGIGGRNLTRRSVVKKASGMGVLLIGVGSSTELVAAKPSEFRRGKIRFLEVKEEYSNAIPGTRTSGRRTGGYLVDTSRNRMTLTNAPVEAFENGGPVVAADGEFYGETESLPVTKSKYHLPIANTNYRHITNNYVALEKERHPPEISITFVDGEAIINGDHVDTAVPIGEDTKIATRQASVFPAGVDTSVSLQEEIQVRDHGQVELFAHEDYLVFPIGSGDYYANARISSLTSLAKEHVSRIENIDLLAVPKDIDITKSSDGGA